MDGSVCASARNQFHSGLARNECLFPPFFQHPRVQCYKIGCYKFRSFSIFIYKDNIFMTRGLFMNLDGIFCFTSFFFTCKLNDIRTNLEHRASLNYVMYQLSIQFSDLKKRKWSLHFKHSISLCLLTPILHPVSKPVCVWPLLF